MAKNRCFALYGVLIIIIAIVWTQIVRAEPPSPTATLAPWNFRACVPNVTIVPPAEPTATPRPGETGGVCLWGEPPIVCLRVSAAWECLQYFNANPRWLVPDGSNGMIGDEMCPNCICNATCTGEPRYKSYLPVILLNTYYKKP